MSDLVCTLVACAMPQGEAFASPIAGGATVESDEAVLRLRSSRGVLVMER